MAAFQAQCFLQKAMGKTAPGLKMFWRCADDPSLIKHCDEKIKVEMYTDNAQSRCGKESLSGTTRWPLVLHHWETSAGPHIATE